jgi:metal-responsive CopG/Arc/MetJ family transcriptional regulator
MDETTDPLAASALMARIPVHIDAVVRSLPNRSAFIRAAITEKLERDGLLHKEDEK